MFTMIKRFCKFVVYSVLGLVGIVIVTVSIAANTDSTEDTKTVTLQQQIKCANDIGKENCDANGNPTNAYTVKRDAEKKAQEEKLAKQKAEEDRIYNLPHNVETRAIAMYEDMALEDCTKQLREIAKYPTKVDFDWLGGSTRTFKNFSVEPVTHRIVVGRTGEAMNGLGLMVPFNGVCKYNYTPDNTTTPIVRVEVLM